MDPNATLERIRELAALAQEGPTLKGDARELAELIQALDEWITRGGFLPVPWGYNRTR